MPAHKTPAYYAEIKNFINAYWEQNNCAPTTREIAAGTHIPKSTVGRYIAEMRDKGEIEYDGHRNFRTREQMNRAVAGVPLVGSIACGLPKLAEQRIEDYVYLPQDMLGSGKFYLLRAKGDSMINIGIHTGDLVLIREQPTAEYGQVVVAQVGDEDATLKTYRPDLGNGIVVLHTENDELEDIVVDVTNTSLSIQGIATDVIHRLP